MRKYLILTYEICNMGGGQLYVLRRCKHLINKGFEVHIVVFYHNTDYFPLEKDFEGIQLHVIPEFSQSSSRFCKDRVSNTIRKLLSEVGPSSEVFIESHTVSTTEWGELVALECKGKHLAYSISDDPLSRCSFEPGHKICEYKLANNQFYGCSSISLKKIFGRIDVPDNYVNVGFDETELVDISVPDITYIKREGEFLISTISRLDKQYIEPLIDGCVLLSLKHRERTFVLLIAGGSAVVGRKDYLEKYCTRLKVDNLKIVFTGYINELGKDIFRMSDVFVGMATASLNAISQNCLTINIDPNNGMKYSSGFFGTDTRNFAFSENGKLYEISDKLEEALMLSDDNREKIITAARQLFCESFEEKVCFDRLDDVILKIDRADDESIVKVSSFYRLYVIMSYNIYNIFKRIKVWDIIKGIIKK